MEKQNNRYSAFSLPISEQQRLQIWYEALLQNSISFIKTILVLDYRQDQRGIFL